MIFKWILTGLLLLSSLVLIIAVAMQESSSSGVSSVMGGSDTFFGKGKSRGRQAKLARITKYSAGAFMVLCVALAIIKF
ncbi:preprotein translocase subunit SecG [Clostridia bacterium OttesenSCG-928-F22]|nr:preprotein translocase subunit SecG [Clostridia bacterium OttesenSCG-928-F22]